MQAKGEGRNQDTTPARRRITIDWKSITASAVALALAFGILYIAWLVVIPLAVLLMSIVLAETLEPLVGWLQRWMRRSIAVITAYLSIVLFVLLIVLGTVPVVLSDISGLDDQLPQFREDVSSWFEQQGWVSQEQVMSFLEGQTTSGGQLATIPLTIFGGLLNIFLAIFLSIYWLIAKPGARSLMLSMVPPEHRERASDVAEEVGATVGGYLRGVVITGGILAVITYIGLTIIGVDYALPLAIIVFFGEFVPILGPIITAIPALGVAAFGGLTQVLLVAGLYIVVQLLENNLIYPQVMKRATSIPPFLVIFAILAGGSVGGLVGALVAIPLAGAIRVLVLELAIPELQHRMGDDQPVRRRQQQAE